MESASNFAINTRRLICKKKLRFEDDSKFANRNRRRHTATDKKQETKIQGERKKREVLFREIEYVEATQKQCMYECRENSVEIVFNAAKDEEEGETCDDERE
ncbi:hypothetical protein CAPTEDRAFT_200296, partial [Capitella teleta]